MSNLDYYLEYAITAIALKHNFLIKFRDDTEWLVNRNSPSKTSEGIVKNKGIEFKYLWKDIPIMSYDNFCNGTSAPSLQHQKLIHV